LYTFTGGTDGGIVSNSGGVIVGSDGNLYGGSTTAIFKLTLGGTLTVLANTNTLGSSVNGLFQGADGNFYGTAGATLGGSFFKVTPAGALTILYPFVSRPTTGSDPFGGVVQGSDGNFYGTTTQTPTVFKVTPSGTYTTMASLAASALPVGPLVRATDGNFYGVSEDGGTSGFLFKMTPTGALTTLYTFCSLTNCADGANPTGGLIQGQDGNLYGTTGGGGSGRGGTIFQLTLAGKLTTLYNFCSQSGCADGRGPTGTLYQSSDGTLYGTTNGGGTTNYGTVFSFQLGPGVPKILTGGIVNAASYAQSNGAGNPVAPGALVAMFTSPLSAQAANFSTATLPPSLGGVSVTFNGITAPMVSVSPTGEYPYISAQVPFGVLPAGQASGTIPVVITVNGTPSPSVQEAIVASEPGIFTIPATGLGNAILTFLNPQTNAPAIAAPPGSGITYPIAPIPRGTDGFFYVTGLGAMTPAVPDGSGTCPSPDGICNANAKPLVMVGGITAHVAFAGQAPGFPGVFQVNITIPQGAPTGSNIPLVVMSADGSVTSNTATIAVQ
jgi:uncharacterized protein (TIGR03437 family)